MKVLFASDGSDCSDRAARYLVKSLASEVTRLRVTLLYVDAPMMDRVAAALGERRVGEIHRENSDMSLRAARRRLKRAGVKFDETFMIGGAASCIARRAREGKYDLVLMGSHGRTALKNLLLGVRDCESADGV